MIAIVLGASLLVASALASALCIWLGRRAFRRFSAGRGKPLLVHVSAEDLETAPTQWPARESRWPRPPNTGTDMPVPIALAYARLAERARQRASVTGQVLILLAGAWLGTCLPAIWALVTDSAGLDMTSPDFAQVVGVILLVEVAMLFLTRVDEYVAMASVYRRYAARVESRQGPAPAELTTAHRWWWTPVLGRLRKA